MSQYKKSAHLPDGRPQCHGDVWQRLGVGGRLFQCSRAASADGFCKQHHPGTVARREAERRARWSAESAEMDRLAALEDNRRKLAADAVELLRLIAAGHNDARARAQEWVTKYDSAGAP